MQEDPSIPVQGCRAFENEEHPRLRRNVARGRRSSPRAETERGLVFGFILGGHVDLVTRQLVSKLTSSWTMQDFGPGLRTKACILSPTASIPSYSGRLEE